MVQNGSAVRLSIDGHTIANAKVDNFTWDMATRDTTTKDSAGFRELGEALRSWNCDASALFAPGGAAASLQDCQDAWSSRATVDIDFGSGTISGTRTISGTAYIVSISEKADLEGNVEYSIKLEGTGQLTFTDHV
jgi:predicted secreted protein